MNGLGNIKEKTRFHSGHLGFWRPFAHFFHGIVFFKIVRYNGY